MSQIPRREVLRKGWLGAIGVVAAAGLGAVVPELRSGRARSRAARDARTARLTASEAPALYANTGQPDLYFENLTYANNFTVQTW
jgi:hypothetical protein